MTARSRLAGAAVALGLLGVAVARWADPEAPPLYDGVIINEPYRWLEPPPGAVGGAQGVSDTVGLEAGKSPLIALATPEQPPQAQVFAPPGALTLPPGTTSLLLSIMPIPAQGTPASGHIAGNVYRISITSQDGAPANALADEFVSVVMRGPDDLLDATMERFSSAAWQPLDTSHAGYTSGFLSIVTEFGDFALVAPEAASTTAGSPAPGPTPGSGATPGPLGDPVVLVALVASAIAVAVLAALLYRSNVRGRQPPRRVNRRGKPRRR